VQDIRKNQDADRLNRVVWQAILHNRAEVNPRYAGQPVQLRELGPVPQAILHNRVVGRLVVQGVLQNRRRPEGRAERDGQPDGRIADAGVAPRRRAAAKIYGATRPFALKAS
jgi:hypothetical protein